MSPFHVVVTTKYDDIEVNLDLSRAQLKKRFLEPYREGASITVSGRTIDRKDLKRIEITHTKQTSSKLLPVVEQQRRDESKRGFLDLTSSNEYRVAKLGTDLTDQFITGPPRQRKVRRRKSKSRVSEDVLQIFLSYSTKDKEIAGQIKKGLEGLGLEVFLAHQDIRPSVAWMDEIVRNLRGCDVFIPLLTKHFRRSKWTDQETGMAVVESKTIVPLKAGIDPHGFLGRYQWLRFKTDDVQKSCEDIVLSIKDNKHLKSKVQNSYIRSFLNSRSFVEANEKSEILEKMGPYERKQINKIALGSLANSQILGGYDAKPKIKAILEKNQKLVNGNVRRKISRVL